MEEAVMEEEGSDRSKRQRWKLEAAMEAGKQRWKQEAAMEAGGSDGRRKQR